MPLKTLNNPKGKTRTMATLNAGKMACSQMARYVWTEQCAITATSVGYDPESEKPDPLNAFLQHVLDENRFGEAFGCLVEKVMALGGGALKEWVEVPKDENGNDAGESKIRISFHMAGQFVPTAWDNSKIRSAIFINREAKDGYYYSVVEWHKWDGKTYRVTNDLYRLRIKEAPEPQNILGWWYPLNLVYPLLSPATEIPDVRQTYFQYIRPFGANYADDNSPLGMSIFAPAMNTLHSLDIMFDSLQREFVLGKKRIIAPARAMRQTAGINNGPPQKYFDADDEVWEALATDNLEDLKIYDNSVELRVNEHIQGINGELSISNRLTGYVPQSDVQAQIDAALKAVKQPDPIDPKTTTEYLELQRERDMLRAIGGDDFAQVKPKFREQVFWMLDRGDKAKPVSEQLTGIKEKYDEYFLPAADPAKDQPKNTPQYSQQPGRTGTNQTSEEDKLFKQLSDAWK